ncbi:MAG: hypothetical protein PVI90_06635 [Desulfobacteraceae bacterium]|jgi:hypothetical protein
MKKDLGLLNTFLFIILILESFLNLFGVPVSQAAVFIVEDTVADGDPDSLRDAIEQANATAEKDTIKLRPGTYILDMGQLEIEQDLEIVGSGAKKSIIDGNENDRVFSITTAFNTDIKVKIEKVTVTNGKVEVQVEDIGEPGVAAYGGGIYNEGILTFNDCIITKNIVDGVAEYGADECGGGGIYNKGNMNINDSSITENTAGGGMKAGGGGIFNLGNLNIKNSNINNNIAKEAYGSVGGGLVINGNTTITNSKVYGNTVDSAQYSDGGGISCNDDSSSLIITDSQITENISNGSYVSTGAGIYSRCQLTLRNTKVTKNRIGNTILATGGGISCMQGATIEHSQIIGNSIQSAGESFGGGLHCSGGTTIEYSQITDNSAEAAGGSRGGGIANESSALTISYSCVTGNTVRGYNPGSSNGGGIYSDAELTLMGSQVTWNTAACLDIEEEAECGEGGGIWIGSSVPYKMDKSVVKKNSPDQIFVEP